MPDTRKLPDSDPGDDERRRCNARRTVTVPQSTHEQALEVAGINDTNLGVVLRKAIHAGLPLMREGEPAERETPAAQPPMTTTMTRAVHIHDRYALDWELCGCPRSTKWAQLDTEADAAWFGQWVNPFERVILAYIEGELQRTHRRPGLGRRRLRAAHRPRHPPPRPLSGLR